MNSKNFIKNLIYVFNNIFKTESERKVINLNK
jgi:hypothetical protein